MTEDEGQELDYRSLAEELKDRGNACFTAGDIEQAVNLYSQAIDIDPDNCVYYSNRSAAYMKADSKSKALKDAEKCLEIDPNFVKGYSRLGAAQQSLKRFDAAIDTFKKGIQLDPNNQSLWSALVQCQAANEADKKERFAEAEVERRREEDLLRRREAAKERALQAKQAREHEADSGNAPAAVEDTDLLSSFFEEVSSEAIKPAVAAPKPYSAADAVEDAKLELSEKYSNQELGSGVEQVKRLTGPHYALKNQNPYAVLQLDIDASEEDIKNRYRKLSTKIHPDKLRDVPFAREAFEEVKKAYERLCDEDQKATVIRNVKYVKEEVTRERRRLLSKGVRESDMAFATLEEEVAVRCVKHFADIEMQRRRSETNLRAHNARERGAEDAEQEKLVVEAEFEKEWSEKDRREKRVGNWRDFQGEAEVFTKKTKLSNFKEDSRTEAKHGQVHLNEWKKKWR